MIDDYASKLSAVGQSKLFVIGNVVNNNIHVYI